MSIGSKPLLVVLTLLLSLFVSAQHYNTQYGQNRIQYQAFDWRYYSTTNFDVYYYTGGQEYAKEAVKYLEEEFLNLTDKIGYAPYVKPKILIYNSIHDLQQSNIGIDGDVYTLGGKTNFVKLDIEVAYPGQAHLFRDEIEYRLAKKLINDMLYGGSLGEIFQNAYLLTLPDWFIDGAARYIAYGWSEEMDNYIRDYLDRTKVKNILKVTTEEESGYVGQSIWNYIVDEYGTSNISNILNLTRIIRKEENSITATLGIGYKDFLDNWQNFYTEQKQFVDSLYVQVPKDRVLSHHKNRDLITSSVRMNPLGDKVAYARIKNGKYYVFVDDLASGKKKLLVKGGFKINNQRVDEHLPLVDWQDAQTVGVIVFRRGNLFLDTYNINSGEKRRKPLSRFRQIESFTFNDNGRLAVISGDIDGKNDLYLISMRRNALRRITNDVYDDIDPVFIPGTAAILFSSNRTSDTLNIENIPITEVTDNFNVFLYDLDTTKHAYYRMTNTLGVDRRPEVKNEYFIYYLSDQKGITNLYQLNLLDTTFTQITNFNKSIKDFDLHFDNDAVSFMMLDEGFHKVYYDSTYNLEKSRFTLPTKRQDDKMTRFLQIRNDEEAELLVDDPPVRDFTIELDEDTTDFDPLEPDAFIFEEDTTVTPDLPAGFIDTDNYQFSDELEDDYRPNSFFSNFGFLERESEVAGPFPYKPRFSFSNITASFETDPWIGAFGLSLQAQVQDVMENHKVKAGGYFPFDFSQGKWFVEYRFLPFWADLRFRIDRKSYLFESGGFNTSTDFTQRYSLMKVETAFSLPITHTFRLEVAPFYSVRRFQNLQFEAVLQNDPTQAQDSKVEYIGPYAAAIYDNTVEKGFNIFHGTKAKLEYRRYQPLTADADHFSNLRLDVRHYQKIHREITLATRGFYGSFWGPYKTFYLLGGVDNWVLPDYQNQSLNPNNPSPQEDPLVFTNDFDRSNLLFYEFATNLRGFDFNEQFGSDALVFNAELRVPVFRYLIRRPIKSNFLRNFQIIGFYDVGTAWTGKPPFTRENAFTADDIQFPNSAFSAEINNFDNPWLMGYGLGLRTVFLGYYLKVDRAIPVRNQEEGNPQWYFSVGLDF